MTHRRAGAPGILARSGPPVGDEGRRARVAGVLRGAGYAVALPPGGWDVHVADRPVDDSGPRYAAVANDVPVSRPWLVMDQWTRVHSIPPGRRKRPR